MAQPERMQISQAGAGTGAVGEAWTGGSAADVGGGLAGEVTITNTAPVTASTLVELLYVPHDADGVKLDTNGEGSLAVDGGDPHVWHFTPTAGVRGPWLVRMSEVGVEPEIRIFGVRHPVTGLLEPAVGERGNEDASLLLALAERVADSQNNEGQTWQGYQRFYRALVEVLEAGGGGGSGDLETTAPVVLYVDGDTGNDANDGSSGSPIQTLAEAESRIPLNVRHPVIVWIRTAAGAYSWPVVRTRNLDAPIIYAADEANDPAVYATLATGATAVGTDATRIVTGGGLGVDAYQNKWVELTTGPAAGHRKQITENDATDVVPAFNFTTAPSASGDTWRVFENAVEIALDGAIPAGDNAIVLSSGAARNTPRGQEGNAGGYLFVGLKLTVAGSIRVGLAAPTVFYGCDVPERLQVSSSHPIYAGLDDASGTIRSVLPFAHLGAPDNQAWCGWGVAFLGGATIIPAGGAVAGFFGLPGGASNSFGTDPLGIGSIHWIGGRGSSVASFAAGVRMSLGVRFGSTRVVLDGVIDLATAARGGVLDVGLVDLRAVAGKRCLIATEGGFAYLRGSGGIFNAIGSSPDVQSVHAHLGGAVYLIDGAPDLGRAAPDTDYDTGNGAPVDKAFFASIGDSLVNAATQSIILRTA